MKNALTSIGGLIVFAIVVLLLERLLRIFQVITNSTQPALDAGSMIVFLLPHYLGIAVPMALLLGIIITIDRFSRSSELTAAYGAGISLFHITKPFILIAVILASTTVFIEGYMQPIGRYNYRQVEHNVKQQSFAAILREGTFTEVGNRMFYAGTEKPGKAIGPIFIYEQVKDKTDAISLRITTAEEGQLIIREETGEPVLQLAEGQGYRILDKTRLRGDLSFESSSVAGTAEVTQFRPRGDDERELTSLELIKNRDGSVYTTVSPDVNNAALHLRIARATLLLIIPFIAVPFGLNYGRNPSSTGLFVGVVMLVSCQKALEFGQSLGAKNILPAWAGVWFVILIVAIFAFYIFTKSAFKMGQPPLTSINMGIKNMKMAMSGRIKRLRRAWVELK
ncbi:MAG: LptF/LptG family permease [Maricaulaceae bacterium]